MLNKETLYIFNTQYQFLIALIKVKDDGTDSLAIVNRRLDERIQRILIKENIVKDIIHIDESIFAFCKSISVISFLGII